MSAPGQLGLRFDGDEPTPELVATFTTHLHAHGWRTRRELIAELRIPGKYESQQRKVRRLAELAGSDVVRGPRGFNHFENVPVEEILHCANIEISQGKHMIKSGIAKKNRCHARIG